ncbi:MAG: DUF2695 domain-containing protein [Planctomycetota bacterium]
MDKQAKRDRLKAWRLAERARALAALPLEDDVLEAMFEALEVALEADACDHTRRKTEAWLQSHDYTGARVAAWLDETGGFCDCAVLFNSMDAWIKATGR